jgi:hypothetical protein
VSTAEERLRIELSRFPEHKVASFLSTLWTILRLHEMAPETVTRSEARHQLEHLKESAEKFLEEMHSRISAHLSAGHDYDRGIGSMLQAIEAAGGPEQFSQRIEEERATPDPAETNAVPLSEGELQAVAARMRALHPPMPPLLRAEAEVNNAVSMLIWELTRELEAAIPIKTGRRRANSDGVLTEIALAYERLLGEEVTSTKGGTFWNIAAIVTSEVDPSRGVLAAVREVVNRRNSPEK